MANRLKAAITPAVLTWARQTAGFSLAEAARRLKITEERLVITIDRQQKVFLNNDPVNINQVGQRIHQKIRDPQGQSIFIRADQDVPFGAFATVMDAVKQAGITNVSIVTQPLEQNGSRR